MDRFLAMTGNDRRAHCERAGELLHLAASAIEKDFWVCWMLRELFSLADMGPQFTFKGGTSLSKGWGLIERFSEDLDVVIDRSFLGFGGGRSPENGHSRKERERRLDRLKAAAQQFVSTRLIAALEQHLGERLPSSLTWQLQVSPDDPDGQTVLFEYESVFSGNEYLRPLVRIELGARSDTEPTGTPNIDAYLARALPKVFEPCSFPIRTVLPKRTFWEKAMLLHEETHRAGGVPPKLRLARHYYDLCCLIQNGVGSEAVADTGLFERVAAHRAVFFRKNKTARESLRPGTLRLVPDVEQLAAWTQDYRAMQEMFFSVPPEFGEVLRVVSEFERQFNQSAPPPPNDR